MALSNMVGNLTVGKKKYADVEGEVKELIAKGDDIILKLKRLVDQDAEVFEPLSKAYGLPKNTLLRRRSIKKRPWRSAVRWLAECPWKSCARLSKE